MEIRFHLIKWKWGVERWANFEFISIGWLEIEIMWRDSIKGRK